MTDFPGRSELQARTEENRMDFLRTDLALCFTLADVAGTELATGDREGAMTAWAKAEDGYRTIAGFAPDLTDPAHRNEVRQRLAALRVVLDDLQQRLHPETPQA
jgi:hypothetical protein